MTIIGVWRALGAVAALSPAQEWASRRQVFIYTGAAASHPPGGG